jgi:hypothetical protein
MAFAPNIEHIEFETADDWAFSSGLETHQVNVLAAPLLVQIEELMRYASGRSENRYYPKLDVELYPFSTRPQTAFPDTSDKIALFSFFKTNKPLRVKDCTLERYDTGGIASARALLLSLKLRVTGVSESLDKDAAKESFTLTLESISPL